MSRRIQATGPKELSDAVSSIVHVSMFSLLLRLSSVLIKVLTFLIEALNLMTEVSEPAEDRAFTYASLTTTSYPDPVKEKLLTK